MTRETPDLDNLIDGNLLGPERDELARAHAALLRVGPLPELPEALSRPPDVVVRRLPTGRPAHPRRRLLLAAAAAAVVATAAGVGYSLSGGSGQGPQRAVAMHATAAAPGAVATLRIGTQDAAGNWPITLRVRGLPALSSGSYYAMYLTDNGRIVGSCGTFKTDSGTTVVELNAPYRLGEYSGWLIRAERPHGPPGPALLATT